MNLKRILAAGVSFSLVFSQAFAADFTQIRAELENNRKTVRIIAEFDPVQNGGEFVIKITKPGVTDAMLSADPSGLLAADNVAVKSGDVQFSHSIGFPLVMTDGRYNVYVSGNGVTPPPEPTEIWYYSDEAVQAFVDEIKSQTSAENLTKVLFEDALVYPSDTKTYDLADRISLKNIFYDESCDAEIAKFVFNDRESISDWMSLKKLVRLASASAAMKLGKSGLVLSGDSYFKEAVFEETSDTAAAEKLFAADLSRDGRDKAISLMKDGSFANSAAFAKTLAGNILYAAVYFNTQSGFGHIPNLINTYGVLTGYDFSAFTNLSSDKQYEAANKIMSSGASDFDSMCAAVAAAVSAANGGTSGENSGTGSGSGGRTGGGTGGVSIGTSGDYNTISDESKTREENALKGFSDMEGYDWARTAVQYLSDRGIVAGVGDNMFVPERSVTRAEFAKLICLASGADTGGAKGSFADVSDAMWYAPYVNYLAEKGIAQGADGLFNPDSTITREDMCTLIYRAFGEETEDTYDGFGDADEISGYARDAVNALALKGIVNGSDGTFKPKADATRAETAVIIYRLVNGGVIK